MREIPSIKTLQFRVLYRVFLFRVVDLEILSADGDTTKLLGQFAAIFAAISFLFTAPLLLLGGTLPKVAILSAEHFLIATTMVAIGLFTVLNWDSIFPDKRDLLVLAPLPVRASTLFLSKLAALAFALGLCVLALNIFSGLVWPLGFFTAEGGIVAAARSLVAYWITILAAGVFIFCCILAVQGIMAQLLSRQYFLRLSAWLQVAAFCLFLGVYILEPSLEAPQLLTAPANQRLLAWLPTYWFLGLFQQMNGSMLPCFIPLVRRAWIGLAIAVFAAGATLLLAYFRTLQKIVQQPDIVPISARMSWPHRKGNSLASAVLLFSTRTLLRSRQHRVILSFYLGIGFALVMAYVQIPFSRHDIAQPASAMQSVPFLIASILMLCIVVAGIRVAFSMPIALRANWIFRITELQNFSNYSAAVRRTLFLLGVVPVWLVTAILGLWLLPLRAAIDHLVVFLLLGVILVDLCLWRFKKIPFTCSYLPGKGNVQYAVWVCALFLLPLIDQAAHFEARMFDRPLGYIVMIAVLAAIAFWIRWQRAATSRLPHGLKFEESNPPEILSMNLNQN